MCIRDSDEVGAGANHRQPSSLETPHEVDAVKARRVTKPDPVSYTHLRAHETVLDLVCRLLLEKKKNNHTYYHVSLYDPYTIFSHYN